MGNAGLEGGDRGKETVETEIKLGRICGGRRGKRRFGGGRSFEVLTEGLKPGENFGGGSFRVRSGRKIVGTSLLEIAFDTTEFFAERGVFFLPIQELNGGYGNLVYLLF